MKISNYCLFAFALISALFSTITIAEETRSEAQKTFDSNYKNAKEISERMQKEATKESMRDKSHDNRIPVGKDTSVGVGKDGVNIRKTY